MQIKEKNNLVILRMFPKENVFESLARALKECKVKTAVFVSGIGQLKNVRLGYFKEKGDYQEQVFDKPLELLSLNGFVSLNQEQNNYDFHLHATLSDIEKRAVGGHLISAAVSVTLEVAFLKTDIAIERKVEEKTGLKGMFLN
ncbi:hypothetical protein COX24_01775 [bacterium (Candidatus Gribaldobacteria) CG23_combo_of_CG06-09_8_20_14_all_37_87_8]|uniref:PPC domain-containing protein n=2 Tax=Candidatus Gribaldobacteria TaxID=2798536 RepID=A0A2G9ZF18_9BACT|nr:MAG: hypothetical protein AUJ25_01095 [Parcubacteria group bacterium CG1_02_37_13]PIP31765.1 MAG: hypothetical protein COX24_01775 [bacterium (Candidatus Gribaldobacteria) CG23_combo_of_CG06-09_8_20_14_all_37_87_8]PIR89826.1 MAG: hypothetical protein COU05_03925 [bacterium (Candidatus Gribaldobacteria) CG10_big_fil_rev_8_21_14_0_10_37_21]